MMIELSASELSVPAEATTHEAVLEGLTGRITLAVRRDVLVTRNEVPVGVIAKRLSVWVPIAANGTPFEFRDDTTGEILLGIRPQGFGWRMWSGFGRRDDRRTWPVSEVTVAAREFINGLIAGVRDEHGVNLASHLTGWGAAVEMAVASRAS